MAAGQKKGRLLAGHGAMCMGVQDRLEIRLPDFQVLRLVARSLLALALLLFFLLRGSSPHQVPNAAVAVPAATESIPSRLVEDDLLLPLLLRDLKIQGLLPSGGRAMFLGRAAGARLSRILEQNKIELVTGCEIGGECRSQIVGGSLDFIFSEIGFFDVGFVDRVLKTGGVSAIRLSSDLAAAPPLASNLKIVYVRRFGSTFVATMKMPEQTEIAVEKGWRRRRLLSVPNTRKEALNGLEDVLLEPPARKVLRGSYLKRTKYLPDLMGDTLDRYPRRLFVEVASLAQGKRGAAAGGTVSPAVKWFAGNYPTRNRNFEVIRVEVVAGKSATAEKKTDRDEDETAEMAGWLRKNVREDEYVVMKAEMGVVEGILRSGAAGLVDELFLDCQTRGGAGRRRAYWECLALYGRLRDAGVAVHQWWWG